MDARAIVIGIDQYAGNSLTSAVHDAEAFRDSLIKLGLVQPEHIAFLRNTEADRDHIGAALKHIYDNGAGLDRLFFYFSGHGMMAPVDAAGAVLCTALIPSDVTDLAADSYRLINFDDLCSRLRFAGPKEQFFFIDACRDLAFRTAPGNVPPINWPASPNLSGPANAQAALYAVSPRGQALGEKDGMGLMTTHLLEALTDDGVGVDWSDDLGVYVITMESIRNCVRRKVQAAVQDRPFWEQKYMLPELVATDPPLTPIRIVEDPPQRPLTVTIEPTHLAEATSVALAHRRNELKEPSWPPMRSGDTVRVQPQRYEIVASSRAGEAVADPRWFDARTHSAAVVRVVAPGSGDPPTSEIVEPGLPGRAKITETDPLPAAAAEPETRLRAQALESNTAIEVDGLDPPYRQWRAHGKLDQEVPPGFYRVRFRIGAEVFSETEVEAVAGSDLTVHPTMAPSAVLAEMLGDEAVASEVVLTETMGPMQSAVLDTMLPIIGVKPFDSTGGLLPQFDGLVPVLHPDDFADRPLSVVVAVEGVRWPWPVEEVLARASCECRRQDPAGETVVNVALTPLPSAVGSRVAAGFTTAPAESFTVTVSSPHFGRIELAAASIPGRITVVTITLSPEGTLGLSQNILRFPGRSYPELVPDVPYGRMLQELQLGRKLYESGELVSTGAAGEPVFDGLWELLHAKWTDPVLGCMAYYAWTDAMRLGLQLPEDPNYAQYIRERTASNLQEYFPSLPDTRVVGGLEKPDNANRLYRQLLELDQVPVLARSARELARVARAVGLPDRRVVRWAERLNPGSPWTAAWDLTGVTLPASRSGVEL
jgi:hypothetical protein